MMTEEDREIVGRAAAAQGVENTRLGATARALLAVVDRLPRLELALRALEERAYPEVARAVGESGESAPIDLDALVARVDTLVARVEQLGGDELVRRVESLEQAPAADLVAVLARVEALEAASTAPSAKRGKQAREAAG